MDHDDGGDIWGVLAGSGVFILEICVLVPGLLAFLVLAVGLTLPLLLPVIPLALLGGLFFAVRGLLRLLMRIARAFARPRRDAAPVSGVQSFSHARDELNEQLSHQMPREAEPADVLAALDGAGAE